MKSFLRQDFLLWILIEDFLVYEIELKDFIILNFKLKNYFY